MARYTLRFALTTIAAVSVLAVGMLPGVTHAADPLATPTPTLRTGAKCLVLRVQLNSDQPAVATCLQMAPASGQAPTLPGPDTSQSSCASTDVQLFQDNTFQGSKICFTGRGFVNLTDYWINYPFTSWNDQASSFTPGNWNGKFYWGTNSSPPSWSFQSSFGGGNFTGAWNDQVSSLCIGATPNSCPN